MFTDPNYNIHDLDIAVNAVATALKDFFKRFPSILTQDQMDDMEEITSECSCKFLSLISVLVAYQATFLTLGIEFPAIPDRSCRLIALRDLLTKKLTTASFNVLKFIFQHFVKYEKRDRNCRLTFRVTQSISSQSDGKLQG